MVLQCLAQNEAWRSSPEETRFEVFAAALMHDIAKPVCTREEDGRISARGHSRVGSRMARRILWGLNVPLASRERIVAMILHHQAPFFVIEKDDAVRRAITMSQRLCCVHLGWVTLADGTGRRCDDQQRMLDNVALFAEFCAEHGCLNEPFRFANDHSRWVYFRRRDRDPHYAAYDDTRLRVTLMSGLPASGKSHWVHKNAGAEPVITLDDIRARLGVAPGRSQSKVIEVAREQARQHLRKGESFIWNATNISRDMREKVIALAAGYGARIRIVYVEAPADLMHERNAQRDNPVPQAPLERMLRRWQVPDLTEAHELEWVESGP
jgi:predicted kinase